MQIFCHLTILLLGPTSLPLASIEVNQKSMKETGYYRSSMSYVALYLDIDTIGFPYLW